MTGSALAVVAANACFFVAGAGLLRAFGGWRTWGGLLRRAGLAYMCGLAAVGVSLQIALIAGLPFGVPLVLILSLGFALTAMAGRRPVDAPKARSTPRALAVPVALVVTAMVVLAVDTLYQPLGVWDAWAQWTAKAKAIVLFDGLNTAYLASTPYQPWNPDYPTALPAIEAVDFVFMGRFDTQVLHLQFWFILAGFLLALAELLRDRVSPVFVWPTLLLIALAPSVQTLTASALADIPVAVFFSLAAVCAWRWLHEDDALALRLLAVFAAMAVATKFEGRIFIGAMFAALVVIVAASERRRLAPLLAAAGVALVGVVPWTLWIGANDVRGIFPTSPGEILGSDLLERWTRLPQAFGSLAARGLDPRAWLVLVPFAFLAGLLAWRAAPDRRGVRFVALTLLLSFAGLLLVYWATPLDVAWHLRQSSRRVVAGPVLFLAALTPLMLAAASDGLRGTGRVTPALASRGASGTPRTLASSRPRR